MAEQCAVTAKGMTKSYGKVRALRGLDLEVKRGEVFGFLGPNGAGKTTTIRCLLDLIRPDGGSARILGIDPQADPVAVQSRTGYLPGELHLDDNRTAEHQLRYFDNLRGGKADWAFVRQLVQRLEVDVERPIKNLSKGNKQKVGIVQALMHQPELLLLDEPTSGLDPLMQQEVLALIRDAKGNGATVFFCSHVMSEVEAIADRVGIIREGKMVEVAQPSALTDRAMRDVTVRFKSPVDDISDLANAPGVQLVSRSDAAGVTLQITGEMDGFVKALAQYPVSELGIRTPSLEEAFLRYYRTEEG
jgi:ABC-2 type transport system ATP-binding protein